MKRHGRDQRQKNGKGLLAAAILVLGLLLAALLAVTLFQIRDAEVTGNSFYSDEEILDLVIHDRYSENSLYLYLKYNYLDPEEIAFVDKIEVSLRGPGRVSLRVYEKSIVGYVSYMGSNFYFDQDGVVVESSSEIREGVPAISGLKFSSLALYKKLAVADDAIFDEILTITQLVKKYELTPDDIEFGDDMSLTLHFGQVRVALGSSGALEEKIGRLADLYPDLEGRSGVFHMENYTEDSRYISFERDE